ncbi:Uncharacterized protein ChrSV_3417 [Chromobacterium vaccinii]|nr:Uncharacterized protein ChrSW_3417 [Chromobacterium vaccinii]QND90874.1 Uncharacterized protein ChrSV_3417 [Chromobacterium vaccinii]
MLASELFEACRNFIRLFRNRSFKIKMPNGFNINSYFEMMLNQICKHLPFLEVVEC